MDGWMDGWMDVCFWESIIISSHHIILSYIVSKLPRRMRDPTLLACARRLWDRSAGCRPKKKLLTPLRARTE